MADRQPAFGAEKSFGIRMGIDVADIGNVVAFFFHPESQRKLPKQELSRPLRQGCIQDLAILSVGPIPADAHAGSPVPDLFAVVVERPLAGPAVVSRPGGVAALEKEITNTVVSDDEYDIALESFLLGGQLAEVNAAGPVFRNDDFGGRFPAAFAQAFFAHFRVGLHLAAERSEPQQMRASL